MQPRSSNAARNSFSQAISQSQDVVWNTITDSAKTRFDYAEFERKLSGLDHENIVENILFLIITGHAAGNTAEDIVAEINQHLVLLGFSLDDEFLRAFVLERKADLHREIKATETALTLFDMGLQTPGILVGTRSILASP